MREQGGDDQKHQRRQCGEPAPPGGPGAASPAGAGPTEQDPAAPAGLRPALTVMPPMGSRAAHDLRSFPPRAARGAQRQSLTRSLGGRRAGAPAPGARRSHASPRGFSRSGAGHRGRATPARSRDPASDGSREHWRRAARSMPSEPAHRAGSAPRGAARTLRARHAATMAREARAARATRGGADPGLGNASSPRTRRRALQRAPGTGPGARRPAGVSESGSHFPGRGPQARRRGGASGR